MGRLCHEAQRKVNPLMGRGAKSLGTQEIGKELLVAENVNNNRRVAIACQGGGSHTAFTAGVLQKLLRERNEKGYNYEIVALSGTSGGSICALLAWYGLLTNDTNKA